MALQGEKFRRVSVSFLMVAALSSSSVSSPLSSSMVKTELPCSVSGCCKESNLGPGPLNLTTPATAFDSRLEGEKTYIYHCLGFFTSLLWFRLRDGKDNDNGDDHHDDDVFFHASSCNVNDSRLEPFPWGQEGRVGFVQGREDNQTVVIPRVRRGDAGKYLFIASNGTHCVVGRFTLKVDCRDPGPSFATDEQPVQAVAVGSNKTLRCAAAQSDCPGRFYRHNVYWLWHNFTSGSPSLLKNSTFESLSVVCDQGSYSGRKCDVHIRHVEPEMFKGEFVCQLVEREDLNMTVRFVEIGTDVETWLPYVLGVAGGVAVLVALAGVIWWRYGHRIEFCFRRQPSRGDFEADVALLCGEDHEELVRETLQPKVRDLGYDVLREVTRPGRLELPENLNAVERSHSVVLTFSAREIAEDGQVDFLNTYVFKRKSPSTVIFVRCPHDENEAEGNPWKNKKLQSFKVLDLPRSLCVGSTQSGGVREARDAEKFLYNVEKHLPKKMSSKSTPSVKPGRNTSSTESHQPLMDNDNAGRLSIDGHGDLGTTPKLSGTQDIEPEVMNKQNGSTSFPPPQPQISRMEASSGSRQLAGRGHESTDDDVFFTEDPQSTLTSMSTRAGPAWGSCAPSADSQPREEEPANVATTEHVGGSHRKAPSLRNDAGTQSSAQSYEFSSHGESFLPVETFSPAPTSPPSEAPRPRPLVESHPRQTSLDIPGELGKGGGRRGEGCEESGRSPEESSVLLESQESGYHSPGSQPEVVPFGQGVMVGGGGSPVKA